MSIAYTIGMDEKGKPLTMEQIKVIVKEAVSEGIDDKLTLLGIDTTDPIRTQQMFQTLRDIVSFRYGMKAKLWGTIIAISVTAGLGWLLIGFAGALKAMIHKGG